MKGNFYLKLTVIKIRILAHCVYFSPINNASSGIVYTCDVGTVSQLADPLVSGTFQVPALATAVTAYGGDVAVCRQVRELRRFERRTANSCNVKATTSLMV